MKNTTPPSGASLATRLTALQQALRQAHSARLLLSDEIQRRPKAEPHSGGGIGGEDPPYVPKLIGVSKTHPAEAILEALKAGLTDFGENKVQEAQAKFPDIKAQFPNARLHLIGPLQSNKAREAVALFDVIHTIDREKIADAVATEIQKGLASGTLRSAEAARAACGGGHGGKAPPSCLIQVNIGEEEQKAGVQPHELDALLEHCQKIGLPIGGLMCIPPAERNAAPYFAFMQKLKQKHQLAELSMGMSSDYMTAIRFGATMVRVGTALFGERNTA